MPDPVARITKYTFSKPFYTSRSLKESNRRSTFSHIIIMRVPTITTLWLFGYTLAQQTWVHYTQNISNWPQPLENNFPPIPVSFEDITQPGILTFSGLSKATTLEALQHSCSTAFINYSSYAVFHSQSYVQPSPSFHPCSLSNRTACRHREPQPSFPSILPASTSSTRLMEFCWTFDGGMRD